VNATSFQPLARADREEAAAAAAWFVRNAGAPPIETVARTVRNLACRIEQTLLLPGTTPREIVALCRQSREACFHGVCVAPVYIPLVAHELAGSDTRIVTVVGFPSGAHPSDVKAHEAAWAVERGAHEIDMVLPIGFLRAGLDTAVRGDIGAVVAAAQGRLVKVILETALLEDEEKIRAVRLAREAGAGFVKTSTGFGTGGATEADVALLRREAGVAMGVKAAGGIRNAVLALRMIACGADRIGTSAGLDILAAVPARSRTV
jgi:deoxyribose-phosphate aldolase